MSVPVAALVLSGLGTATTFAGQIQAGRQAQAEGRYRAAVAKNNSIIAMRKAEDARLRGELEAERQGKATAQLIGRQKAALAAGGVANVSEDSSGQLIRDTAAVGRLDALTIQSNAEREALGFEAQGVNFEADARLAALSGENARSSSYLKAGSTLLSGFGSVADKWYTYKGNTWTGS